MDKFKGSVNGNSGSEKREIKHVIFHSIGFSFLLMISLFLQTSGIKIFSQVPDMTFALICSIGFIAGERSGAIFGIVGGVLIYYMGGSGFSLFPLMYMLCGYLCGALRDTFLSANFLTFLLYGALAGVIREIFTFIHFGLLSNEFNVGELIVKLQIPEYFAYLVCVIPAYFAVLGIYLLFRGKDNRSRIRK